MILRFSDSLLTLHFLILNPTEITLLDDSRPHTALHPSFECQGFCLQSGVHQHPPCKQAGEPELVCGQHLHKAGVLTVVGMFALSAGHTSTARKELGLERMREVEVGLEEPCSCLFLVTWVALASGLLAGHLGPRFGFWFQELASL